VARLFAALFLALAFTAPVAAAETWRKAETHHFAIYSNGKEKQLSQFAHELERLDALLRFAWKKEPVENPNRLTIYLLKNAKAVDNLLSMKDTPVAGIYFARPEGSFAIGNRKRSNNKGALTGKQVLFHEYAHHFFFQNFKIPAASWFVEGFADYVATAEFDDDGHWRLGMASGPNQLMMAYGGKIAIRDLLTATPFEDKKWQAFYGWSWGLTHMLYSREQGRGSKISSYLGLINSGTEPLAAAEQAFGDLDDLQAALKAHVVKPTTYQKSTVPLTYRDQISISELPEFDSKVVTHKLQRLVSPNKEKTLRQLRELVTQNSDNAEAWYQLAEAEYELVHDDDAPNAYDFSAAKDALEKAISADPKHLHANVMMGNVILEAYDHNDDFDDANWEKARSFYRTARDAHPHHPWPLFNLAYSFQKQGEFSGEISPAIKTAFEMAPEVGQYRLFYAQDLASRGEFDEAIKTARIIANNPHGRGKGAQSFINQIETMRDDMLMGHRDDDEPAGDSNDTND